VKAAFRYLGLTGGAKRGIFGGRSAGERWAEDERKPFSGSGEKQMQVQDYMTRKVTSMKPMDNARDARELMTRLRIQQVPILVRGKLVGIVTDRDIRDAFPTATISHLGNEIDEFTRKIKLESIMSGNVLTISPTASIADAAELLRSNRIGALPVVDGDKLVGIITRSDVLAAVIDAVRPSRSQAGGKAKR
jgi:CBS domain-containing protein